MEILKSDALEAIARDIQPALDGAKKEGSGIRNWSSDEKGIAGATFDLRRYRLGGGELVPELDHMVAEVFAAGAADQAVKAEVRRLTEVDAAKVGALFDAWVRSGAAEDHAVAGLAGRIAASSGRHQNLQFFAAKGGGATARNCGVVIVDPVTREAIWIFGRAVRMSTRRQDTSPR